MPGKVTAPRVFAMKAEGAPIVCVTAYDAALGRLADAAGVDVVLVGDSLGNVVMGLETTVPVTLADMVHHVRATRAGVSDALLVADMPFGSYGGSVAQAVDSAVELARAGAEAVKIEGDYPEIVEAVRKIGLPVMGHVGMTPQSVNVFGGFKVQGKGGAGEAVLAAARSLDSAGVFAMVLELVPAALATEITGAVGCPTIGIGAGPGCDGQIQVLHDIVGLSTGGFKHARAFSQAGQEIEQGVRAYAESVRARSFPTEENSF